MGQPATAARNAQAVRIVGPESYVLEDVPEPVAGRGQSVVRPAFVGLCGTDLDLLAGTMPYFASGHARYPLQPGHEWSGTVVGPGTSVIMDPVVGCGHCAACATASFTHCQDRTEFGVRNGMDGALATSVLATTANLIPVPPQVSLRDAALVEPMVTSLEGIRRIDPKPGEEALVVGAGTLGLVATMVLSARGVRTHVLLRNRARADAAEASGGVPCLAGGSSAQRRYRVVIEAAGTPEGVQAALAHVAPGGRMSILGVPTSAVSIDIASVVVNDVVVHGVLNGPGQFRAGLQALAEGVVSADVLIDRIYPFSDLPAAIARARERGRPRPKVLVQMDGPDR